MIEPGPHAVHPVVQIIVADRDFGDIEHTFFLSRPRIGKTVMAAQRPVGNIGWPERSIVFCEADFF
jgi:hypothetical protein